MSIGAKTRGVQGVVIDGGCRDLAEHREMGFPVRHQYHLTSLYELIERSLRDITPLSAKGHSSDPPSSISRSPFQPSSSQAV
jgi:hypothetical protein